MWRGTLLLALLTHASACDDGSPPTPLGDQTCDAGCHCNDGSGYHCEGEGCAANVCTPPCGPGEICVQHLSDTCQCGAGAACNPDETCIEGICVTPCEDGEDNDDDGWVDMADPDCHDDSRENGTGPLGCNDDLDNDGDGLTDAADPQCQSATADEVLGEEPCLDECVYHATRDDGREICDLWDAMSMSWAEPDGDRLHDRARLYTMWMHEHMLAAGGVVNARFEDEALTVVRRYNGVGDSAIWTGTYLAAEAHRYLASHDPDALSQIATIVRVLHDFWNVAGDPGYLARFAALADSDPIIVSYFEPDDPGDHMNVEYQGQTWHWRGEISRDQYQGVMLGYSFAYQATHDPDIKEMIREDVVELVEQLMREETRRVRIVVDGIPIPIPIDIEMPYCVFTDDETPDGEPAITVDTSNLQEMGIGGFIDFWPDASRVLRQIPGLHGTPSIPLPGQAVMLASFFRVALQVTEGVSEYESRRRVIAQYYEDHVNEWLDIAEAYPDPEPCGEHYFGIHIVFEPLYNLARLEDDPIRSQRIRNNVLKEKLWFHVADHKNVLFAYIYAAHAPDMEDVSAIVALHNAQLQLFPPPPRVREPRDLSGLYPSSDTCPDQTTVATDVDHRVVRDYIWQRNPWELLADGDLTVVYPGVDYLIAYWMARLHGFLPDDATSTCLRWRAP